MKGLLFFLLLFFNYLNPISPILTLVVDILIVAFAMRDGLVRGKTFSLIVRYGVIIWVWSILVMTINLHFDTYIFIKYFRMPLMAVLLSVCVSSLKFDKNTVINSLFWLCFINLLSIVVELIVPSTRVTFSQIFRSSREDLATEFNFRVLGLTGSFEICAILCILLMVVCSYKYKKNQSLLYLIIMFVSFGSLAFVSRTGMLVGFAFLAYLIIGLYKSSKKINKAFIGLFSFAIITLSISFILPIIINSSGLFDDNVETRYDIDFGRDYGIGTASQLSSGGSHMNILKEPFHELVVGYGVDSENFKAKNIRTDIGYLEYICHIGIVGLTLVLILHLLLIKYLNRQRKMMRKMEDTGDLQKIYGITILYIVILLIFNYKLMLLYSRGTFELMVILIFAAEKLTKKQKQLWISNTI